MPDPIDRLNAALEGRYVIERELGSGGMATVYLAEDVKHRRKVAIKVLRPELAAALGAERFLREIEIVAQLHHPHIMPLYDSGEADGFLYYVMPYEEGPSLRAKLAQEVELPVPEAIRLLRDIVDALAHAHRQGLVHRDIKPDNVMLSGRHALVTDFGVAKAVSQATGQGGLTTAGMALGTPVYMAPEQAVADPHIDHRADIYAVGAVAYEMLAGRPPFHGNTAQAILAAHVTEVPEPVTAHRTTVPPALSQMVMRCLEKKAADRWQSADELLAQLEALASPSGGITPTATQPVPSAPGKRHWLALSLPAAAALGVIAVVLAQLLGPAPISVTTSNITQVTRDPGVEFQPAISPDGGEVAYVEVPVGSPRIVVRSTIDVGTGGAVRLADGLPGSHLSPVWTPDGASVRFRACPPCDWREVGKHGGTVRRLGVPRESDHYAWSRDGTRVAFVIGDSILTAAEDRGQPDLLAVHPRNRGLHSLVWSPDGRLIAYVNGNPQWPDFPNVMVASLWIVDAAGGAPVQATDEESMNVSPQWLPDSRHLVFVSDRDGPRGIHVIEVGPDGPRGLPRSVLGSSDPHSISISADGRRLAYAKFTSAQNIWSVAIPESGSVSIRDAARVTEGNQFIEQHDLSPDGEWIAYDSNIRGGFDIYKRRVVGGQPQLVADLEGHTFAPDWSPDGAEIAFYSMVAGGGTELFVVSADGGTPVQLTDLSPSLSTVPDWSPDGLTIAFQTGGLGAPRTLWTVSRDSVGGPWGDPVRMTDVECGLPVWMRDGMSLVCRLGSGSWVRVSPDGEVLDPSVAGLQPPRGESMVGASPDGARIYFIATHQDGSRGIWWIPADGGDVTELVAFDDPQTLAPIVLSVGRESVYLTVPQRESDIWVMDLEW